MIFSRLKKALLKNQTLEEFDREIFESIVEKVIIGGYDENGKEDPYKIIFIYEIKRKLSLFKYRYKALGIKSLSINIQKNNFLYGKI